MLDKDGSTVGQREVYQAGGIGFHSGEVEAVVAAADEDHGERALGCAQRLAQGDAEGL